MHGDIEICRRNEGGSRQTSGFEGFDRDDMFFEAHIRTNLIL